jgi:glycosyltransferase involved in cell wall biosynthesis
MKIAWVTPLAQRSAIGRVSAAVVRALCAQNHEVTIIRSEHHEDDGSATHLVSVPTLWWRNVSPTHIALQNDVIVLNFGDHFGFHAGTLAFAGLVPCLGIFHDFYLYDLFYLWLAHTGLDEKIHEDEVRSTYGENACELARMAWRGNAPVERIAETMPMTEWLGRRCGAALAHSHFYAQRLENSCPGPVSVAPLCYEGRQIAPLPQRQDSRLTITAVGVINPNRCIDAVIGSIASSAKLRTTYRLRLVGAITQSERDRLEELCRRVGFTELTIVGEVDDAVLTSELERADILSCLRNPVLEGASASAIEGMQAGRPIIVADAGFYSELPDDLVFKIPSSVDIPSLTDVLERLLDNEPLRRNTGAKAQKWALRRFTTDTYLPILEGLMLEFINAKPMLSVGKHIAHQLARLGIEPGDPAVEQLASKMVDLFDGNR